MIGRKILAASLALALVAGLAVAQQTGAPGAPQAAGNAQFAQLRELRREARHLTLLNSLPEAARADAEALLGRMEASRTAEAAQRLAFMQAYVDALEAGQAPADARQAASAAVAEQFAALEAEREALRQDMQAFMTAHPEVRSGLGQGAFGAPGMAGPFGAQGRSGMGPFGAQDCSGMGPFGAQDPSGMAPFGGPRRGMPAPFGGQRPGMGSGPAGHGGWGYGEGMQAPRWQDMFQEPGWGHHGRTGRR